MCWKILADWILAIGTLVLAIVAVLQDQIRGLFYRPKFVVTAETKRPDCVLVPTTNLAGVPTGDRIYLRVRVTNSGNAAAKSAEVYARELRKFRPDGQWETVKDFPPMNLKWADIGSMYWPSISPDMGKHCDVVHVHDPARRRDVGEESMRLALPPNHPSMAFDLITAPNHMGHIVGHGVYDLDILVAAENARPHKATVRITMDSTWVADETKMFQEHVGIKVL